MKYPKKAAMGQQKYVVDVRRALHKIPELRWEEEQTLDLIRETVIKTTTKMKSGVVTETQMKKGGLVVDVTFNKKSDRILFRADVDGLPVREETGLPFAATNGRMHACGHDINTAILLGAFRAIVNGEVSPKHNLRFVFQRAEENPVGRPSGGDVLVNEENLTDGIAAVYGLHIWAHGTKGVFYSRPGALLGNSGRLGITIACSGGHVAMPHGGANAIRIAHAVMQALDQFNATALPPTEPHTLEPACLVAGDPAMSNTMPGKAVLWYGARSMLPRKEHETWMVRIESVVRQVVACFSADAIVKFERVLGHPATINTPNEVARVAALLADAGERYEECPPELGGEDFAHYLMKRPGVFAFLSGHREGSGDHHSPTLNPDESVFWHGVHYWLLLATN
jgi:amidohydrolase